MHFKTTLLMPHFFERSKGDRAYAYMPSRRVLGKFSSDSNVNKLSIQHLLPSGLNASYRYIITITQYLFSKWCINDECSFKCRTFEIVLDLLNKSVIITFTCNILCGIKAAQNVLLIKSQQIHVNHLRI